MRKLILLFAVAAMLPVAAHAQSFDFFGGYSYLRLDSSPKANLNGWNVSVTDNFIPMLGVTADFSGTYGTVNGVGNSALHTFLFGPQLRFPAPVSPFVHALFGVAHDSGGGTSDNAFTTGLGGGIDINVVHFVRFRPIQVDYVASHFNSRRQDNVRLSAGIVIHF